MSDKVYDFLSKFQRWLPAFGLFYLALSSIWNLPYGEQINQTVIALGTLLAATLEIATGIYNKKKERTDAD